MSNAALTLYRLQSCPFCERVVRLLEANDLEYDSRFVEPMHSERNVVKRVSGKRSVPALVDRNTGATLTESANIVSYLETTYGEGRLRTDADGIEADTGAGAATAGEGS